MTNAEAWWRRDDMRLIGIGVVLAAIYVVLFPRQFFLPLLEPSLLPRENSAQLFLFTVRAGGALPMGAYVAGLALAFGLYAYAWRVSGRLATSHARRIVILFAVIFGVIGVLTTPAMTSDLYDYAMRARQVVAYGQNPLVTTTAGLANDPWFPYIFWRTIPTPYGPVWIVVSLLPYVLSGGSDFIAALIGLKLLMLVVFLANVLLINHILGRLSSAHQASGTLIFAWSPLILLELLVNGHNDGVLVLPLLLCLLALVAGRWLFVFPALAVAALVKAPALLLLPVIAIVSAQRVRARLLPVGTVIASLGLASLVVVAMYGVFWSGPETLNHIGRSTVGAINYSIPAAVAWGARRFGIDPGEAGRLASYGGYIAFFIGTALVMVRLWRRPSLTATSWLRAGFDTIALFLLVGTAWFFPWYVSWLLALAALVMHLGRQRVAIIFSALAPLYYFIGDFLLPVAPYFTGIAMTALVFGLPSLLLVWELWQERSHRGPISESPVLTVPPAVATAAMPQRQRRQESG